VSASDGPDPRANRVARRIARDTGPLLARLARVRARSVFALALVLHLGALGMRHTPPLLTENLRAGFTLAEKGYLGDPFSAPTGPTAHLSPVYPVIVAVADRVMGSERRAIRLLAILSALLASANAALLVALARRLRLPPASGVLAALVWMFPFYSWIELSGEHETVLTTSAVLLTLWVLFGQLTLARRTRRDGAMLGAVTGVAVHFTPLILPMVLVAFATAWAARHVSISVPFLATAAITFVAAVLPYTMRNRAVMGSAFLVRDNLGLEVAVSNGDVAEPAAEDNIDAAMKRHPYLSVDEAHRMRAMGEVAYNKSRLREGVAWIRTHPLPFLRLTAERAGYVLLFPRSNRLLQRGLATLLAIGFYLGLAWLWRAGERMTVAALGGAVAGYELIYLFVQHDIRYVYPMMWIQSLVAASFAVYLARQTAALVADGAPADGETTA
jgi:hypothetical protein